MLEKLSEPWIEMHFLCVLFAADNYISTLTDKQKLVKNVCELSSDILMVK